MRTLALLSLFALGCNAQIVGNAKGPPGGGGEDGGGGGDTDGMNQSQPCPAGQHLEGQTCINDELTCANEFPCPDGFTCSGGRCIPVPGPCASNDDCPTGDVCVMGNCAPLCADQNAQCKSDKDCGPSQLCVVCKCVGIDMCQKPTADLSGAPWQAHQILHLDEALNAFSQVMVSILKKLRDGILGCPKGSSNDCFLYQIIAGVLPDWSKTLIVALGNFGDLIDDHNFIVDSEMTFKKNNKPSSYDGVDHWQMLSFNYQNMPVMKKPEDLPQIGKPVFVDFKASGVCGILYVDKHEVKGVLSGILKWIVDTAVEISTKGQYKSLSAAIDGSIDCSKINDFAAQAACVGFKKGLAAKIDQALNAWLLNYSLMTLKGTAVVNPNGHALENGHWDGTLGDGIGIFDNFTGEWSAKR